MKIFVLTVTIISFLFANITHVSSVSSPQDRNYFWIKDIENIRNTLIKKHPNLFFQTSKEAFMADFQDIIDNVPQYSDNKICIMSMKAVAKISDPHTQVYYQKFRFLPIKFVQFPNGCFLAEIGEEYSKEIGKKLVAIDGKGMCEVMDQITSIISTENVFWPRVASNIWLASPEAMFELGICASQEEALYRFCDEDGKLTEVLLKYSEDLGKIRKHSNIENMNSGNTPIRWRNPEKRFFYSILGNDETLYICFRECPKTDFDSEFQTLIYKPIKSLLDNKKPTKEGYQFNKVIIDFRDNSGGNSMEMHAFLMCLIRMRRGNFRDVIALIDWGTFSSGALNAFETVCCWDGKLDKSCNYGLLIGVPTGNMPYGWGWCEYFKPKTNCDSMTISCSTRFVGDKDMKFTWNSLVPDIDIPLYSQDYFNLKDPQLDRALTYDPAVDK